MDVQSFIMKNNLITLLSRFTFAPKIGIGLHESRINFYSAFLPNLTYKYTQIWRQTHVDLKMNSHDVFGY